MLSGLPAFRFEAVLSFRAVPDGPCPYYTGQLLATTTGSLTRPIGRNDSLTLFNQNIDSQVISDRIIQSKYRDILATVEQKFVGILDQNSDYRELKI